MLDDEMEIILLVDETEAKEEKKRCGKGNAILGVKAEYQLYPPSNVVERVVYILFTCSLSHVCTNQRNAKTIKNATQAVITQIVSLYKFCFIQSPRIRRIVWGHLRGMEKAKIWSPGTTT